MASDILVLQEKLPCYNKRKKYNDHILENKILDIDEPQYENCGIIRELLRSNLTIQVSPPDSVITESDESLNSETSSRVEGENIYENVAFIQRCKQSQEIKENSSVISALPTVSNDTKKQNYYRSTFSFIIGEPDILPNEGNVAESTSAVTYSITEVKQGTSEIAQSINKVNQSTTTVALNIAEAKHSTSDVVYSFADIKQSTSEVAHIPKVKQSSSDIVTASNDGDAEGSDDGSFKSSYAKSLIDSYRQNSISPSQISPTEEPSGLSSPSPNQDTGFKRESRHAISLCTEIHQINNGNVNQTSPLGDFSGKVLDQLEKKVKLLTENICHKDKELDRLKQDLITLRLEFSRVKAENRSLKISQNMNLLLRQSPIYLNGDSQSSSLNSFSVDSDTWTLQQQIMSLNSQLERAELSRHAYESATRQLVHFLQTINTTLSTVAAPDMKHRPLIQSPFNPHYPADILNQLENTLIHHQYRSSRRDSTQSIDSPTTILKPMFNSNGEGAFIESGTPVQSFYVNADLSQRTASESSTRRIHSSRNLTTHKLNGDLSPSTNKARNKEKRVLRSQSSSGKSKLKVDQKFDKVLDKYKREIPQQTSSVQQKIWPDVKRSTLMRSGSVNNIPTEQITLVPRVSRAVSTHCVATNKIFQSDYEEQNCGRPSPSNRLLSARAKGFFSSLKNLFKNDSDKSLLESSSARKKMSLPVKHHNSKAKLNSHQDLISSPLSLMSPDAASNGVLKKSHSMKADSANKIYCLNHDSPSKCSAHNSIFYVPYGHTDQQGDEEEEMEELSVEDAAESASEDMARTLESDQSAKYEADHQNLKGAIDDTHSTTHDEEISGPQELSVTLSLHQGKFEEPDIGTDAHSSLSGDGFLTESGTCDNCDSNSHLNNSGDGVNSTTGYQKKANNSLRIENILICTCDNNRNNFHSTTNGAHHTFNLNGVCDDSNDTLSPKSVTYSGGASVTVSVNCGSATNSGCGCTNLPTVLKGTTKVNSVSTPHCSDSNATADICSFSSCKDTKVNCSHKKSIVQSSLSNKGTNTMNKKLTTKGLKHVLWKLARSSYRNPSCRLEFV